MPNGKTGLHALIRLINVGLHSGMASPPAGYRKLILNARRFGPALDGLRSVETVSGLLERTSGPLQLVIGDIQHSAHSLLNVTSSQSQSESKTNHETSVAESLDAVLHFSSHLFPTCR
ncbi:hypothetical protein ATANTOWER_011174 [Ataeniobius toweri]|uniref:Uncharacterized protein n=1 Tax=Ataeniobius toweri TaxID=208326 RepID=A0ABU7BF28_9TELE|nr:hypothetical protein [Ataeniobius toweri]